jgi:hypothetical protein
LVDPKKKVYQDMLNIWCVYSPRPVGLFFSRRLFVALLSPSY